jgi:hypothetical protein
MYHDFTGTLAAITTGDHDTNIPNTDVKVKCIKLVIGGSGSWVDERAYVKDISLNGVPQPLPDIGEVITVKVEEWRGTWWTTLSEGYTLKEWKEVPGKVKVLDDFGGVGAVRITLHFKESAGNEYQNICGDIDFTFTLWQGP